jgi:UDP-4-amino-4,6-dideoxy-N-acetyl-beta-L-altrosamine N-acetyltransferase
LAYRLRPIQESDLDTIFEWRNSDRIRKVSYHDHLITKEEHLNWFKQLQLDGERASFIFEEEGRSVGTVNLVDVDYQNKRCRWGFYLGEDDLKKGTGTEMGKLALDYAFDQLKLEKICAETFDWNEASIAFHLKLGFQREGLLRKHQMKEGRLQDLVVFGLLREAWIKRRKDLTP